MGQIDQIIVWFQNFVGRIFSWLSVLLVGFSSQPAAWLGLAVAVILGIANYRIARAKLHDERLERAKKVFSVSLVSHHGFLDHDTLRISIPSDGPKQIILPMYLRFRLSLNNQTLEPIYVQEIWYELVCHDIHDHLIILARHKHKLVIADVLTRKLLRISDDSPLMVEPALPKILDGISDLNLLIEESDLTAGDSLDFIIGNAHLTVFVNYMAGSTGNVIVYGTFGLDPARNGNSHTLEFRETQEEYDRLVNILNEQTVPIEG